jgi:hypothetical protein
MFIGKLEEGIPVQTGRNVDSGDRLEEVANAGQKKRRLARHWTHLTGRNLPNYLQFLDRR